MTIRIFSSLRIVQSLCCLRTNQTAIGALCVIALLFPSPDSFSKNPSWNSINGAVTLSGGPGWYQAGQTQNLLIQPDFLNTYVAQKNTQDINYIELFLGIQMPIIQHLKTQLGIAFAEFNSANLNGQIWELGDPTFNNFNYQYRINHRHIAFEGKFLSDYFTELLPYFSFSLGIANNRASSFSSTPVIFEVLPEPGFSSKTQHAFTYSLGVGLTKILKEHWQIGVGYLFTDQGKSVLGPSAIQTTTDHLTLNHLYINTLEFSLSYLF